MSKSLVLKIILGGFLVFLLLPAFYDEEKPAQKSSFEGAQPFDPDASEGEELPIVEEESSSKGNIFTRYGKRFKKMYGRAFLGAPAEKEESPRVLASSQDENDDDLYYAMAMLFNGTQAEAGLRSSYARNGADGSSVNALPSGGYSAGSSPLKQTVHDNAPVKGLYESSFAESYENRHNAKRVYGNVMNKVDRTVPSQKAALPASSFGQSAAEEQGFYAAQAQDVSSAEGGSVGSFNYSVPGMVSTPGWAADLSDSLLLNGGRFKRAYVGIAGRSSGKNGSGVSSSRFGSSGGFGLSSSHAALTDEDRGIRDLGDFFYKSAADITAKIKDEAQTMRDRISDSQSGEGSSSGGSSLLPDIPMPGGKDNPGPGQSGGVPGAEGGGQGGSGISGGNGEGGNVPAGGDSPDKRVPPPADSDFNADNWDVNINSTCTVQGDSSSDMPSIALVWGGFAGGASQQGAAGGEDPEDKVPAGCGDNSWSRDIRLSDDVSGRNFLVDLGAAQGENGERLRATPSESSVAEAGLGGLGIKEYVRGSQKITSGEDAFTGIDRETFNAAAGDSNTVIITTSQAVAERYVGRTVLINEGDLEKKSSVRQIADKLNNMEQETQRILALKAAREAGL